MVHIKESVRVGALSAISLLALAGTAHGQDSGLSMALDRSVIASGESVHVEVAGRFPMSAFALAQVDFDVLASIDAWTAASTGVLAGSSVLNASFDQVHAPFAGIFADPTNPLPIWQGTYKPNVAGPAFLRLRAEADSFAYYPSNLTSSTVVVDDALPGRQYLWVDPVHIAGVGEVAPAAGTAIEVLPDGSIVATPEEEQVLIGLLLPAVQKVREAATRTRFEAEPESVRTSLLLSTSSADVVPTDQLSLNFAKIEDSATGRRMYELTSEGGFSHYTLICLIGPNNELICPTGSKLTAGGDTSAPLIRFDRLPTCLTFTIEEDDITGEDVIVASTCDDQPFFVEIPGHFSGLTTGPVKVSVRAAFPWDLNGIKGKVVEARGLPTGPGGAMTVRFSTPCVADFDGDGELTVLDLLDFMDAFAMGLRGADVDGDGDVTVLDVLDFLAVFDAGCA